MTEALKFGAHFLVYQGDPLLFHAKYLVVVCEDSLSQEEFIAYSRSANSANKSLLIAQVQTKEDDYHSIHYCTVSHSK